MFSPELSSPDIRVEVSDHAAGNFLEGEEQEALQTDLAAGERRGHRRLSKMQPISQTISNDKRPLYALMLCMILLSSEVLEAHCAVRLMT